MTELLLSLHVLAAILAIGPVAVAASMFPRYARLSATVTLPDGPAVPDTPEAPDTPDAHDARTALGGPSVPGGPGRSAAGAALLHRVCRAYAIVGVSVPVFGIATGAQLGVLTDAWLIASLILTTLAAVLLGAVILPAQGRLLEPPASRAGAGPDIRASAARLAGATGAFNLLWALVVVLMIVRPGSTTGA